MNDNSVLTDHVRIALIEAGLKASELDSAMRTTKTDLDIDGRFSEEWLIAAENRRIVFNQHNREYRCYSYDWKLALFVFLPTPFIGYAALIYHPLRGMTMVADWGSSAEDDGGSTRCFRLILMYVSPGRGPCRTDAAGFLPACVKNRAGAPGSICGIESGIRIMNRWHGFPLP